MVHPVGWFDFRALRGRRFVGGLPGSGSAAGHHEPVTALLAYGEYEPVLARLPQRTRSRRGALSMALKCEISQSFGC